MENIEIKGYKDEYFVPSVNFNANTGICEISGESYLDDNAEFYDPLLNWLEIYYKEVNKPIIFNFNLTYFDTSSSKRIYHILSSLKDYESNNGLVSINWYLRKDDAEIIEEIKDLCIAADMEINLIYTQDKPFIKK